ncbi:metallo-beta-lactamase superfamily protein [Colletotrichum truncatum]|uniref:Metallo-beta-lactamase superfamily protein n=1 Tax=Colletotrichum truncatum TaxID=5467 RepID=A0ACC3YFK5_COLTU|nr:metallo-beta-lactamase superfamily protein [Colletotrichum truncatum]KAF6788342.1 metallo-beta-lactamase superfamily protein [Colletotrichum truncatum]
MLIRSLNHCVITVAGLAEGHGLHHRENDAVQDPTTLLSQGINALGGDASISSIRTLSYTGSTILRGKTLMLGISVKGVDNAAVTSGQQTITYSFDEQHVKQRIDKVAALGPGWTFGRANLAPMDFSLLVEGGDDGFAAVVRGSYDLYSPGGQPQGYLDGLLSSYLISEANKWHPLLLTSILANGNFTYRSGVTGAGIELPGVHDNELGLTVLFDPNSNRPYIIRSYENHPFFGASTHDLLVYDYIEVSGVQFPQRFKTIYNGKHLIGDYRADEVVANAELASDFFTVHGNVTIPVASVPVRDAEYDFSEIGETSAIFLWPGAYTGTSESIAAAASRPFEDLPGLWVISPEGPLALRQAVVELEDGSVIVLDAPPHQSKLVMEWAQTTLGKNITHVWPTHHHHDHAFGAVDYVANGAKLIVPEHAAQYYATVPKDQIVTYKRGQSMVLEDSKTLLALVDMDATIHAEDHGYALIQPACPTNTSSVAVFDADHGNLAFLETFEHAAVHELLDALARDKVATTAAFLPAHGPAGNITDLTRIAGYLYPSVSPKEFVHGQPAC